MNRTGVAACWAAVLMLALAVAACGSSAGSLPAGATPTRTSPEAAAASVTPTNQAPAAAGAGKDLTNFDPCSVVSDKELVDAITAVAGDPSALGTITPTHGAVDGALTGLPGAKACKLSWTTTDSAGRQSQGGNPVIVTFDLYSNLPQILGNSYGTVSDYASVGALAYDAPGDGGDPHITKNGYLFRLSGNSDLQFLKLIALGIATRL